MPDSELTLDGRVLGSMELLVCGTPALVSAPKERLLLAILLSRPGVAISADRLMDELWGEQVPRTARKNLQVYVSALRKRIGNRLTYDGQGYLLDIKDQELDLLKFERLACSGRRTMQNGDLEGGALQLAKALELWRGEPLTEFYDSILVTSAASQWADHYLGVYEDWAEYETAAGRWADVLSGLDALVAQHPSRERLVGARMKALVLSGRAPDAIRQYLSYRSHLVEEFGIDPSQKLTNLYESILSGRLASASTKVAVTEPARPAPCFQLPRGISDFAGRQAELDWLENTDAPLVAITGEVGVGKTTLAIHAAHRLRHRYPDGAQFVLLGSGAASDEGVHAIQREHLTTVGIRLEAGEAPAVSQAVWRSSLADRRMLLLLDDAPHEDAVRALLPGTADAKVLVTSRRRLSGLESVDRVALDEFQADDALQFVSGLIGPRRLVDCRDAVLRLMDRWGRSPTTLRIIGQRLAGLAGPTFRALLDRLSAADDALDEFAAGDRSLRRILTACYGAPDWEHHEAFAALGRLPRPPFRHDLLITALQEQGLESGRAIEALLEAGVLRYLEGEVLTHALQYAMSPLAHSFAVELNRQTGRVTDRL